ncbi:MAG: formylglycine-generating enzyme family protein [Elusimicrobiota bacterium]
MKKTPLLPTVAAALISLSPLGLRPAFAQTLTNDSVIQMAGLGLDDEIILTKIQSAGCDFDTSPSALAALKKAGVSTPVVKAMIQAPCGKPPEPEVEAEPARTLEEAPPEPEAPSAGNDIPGGMAFVKGGCFQMGDTFTKNPFKKNAHEVCLDDFLMDKTEVTQAAYEKAVGENPSHLKGCADCPVETVSWHDADDYCRKIGKRLPTEAEWEYAAREGGERVRWSGTSELTELSEYAWYKGNSGGKVQPVGRKKPNKLGLHDMTGNVWEWVRDFFSTKYYKKGPKHSPPGPQRGFPMQFKGHHVIRGGGVTSGPSEIEAALRFPNHRKAKGLRGGFRCAQSP